MLEVENLRSADSLDQLLGDPCDETNPLSFEQIMEADENHQLPSAGESLLDQWGFNAEFVPHRLGGRLCGIDRLIDSVRPVFRRDAALGLGYGVTSLMAAVNVWAAGSANQQRRLSGLLLSGKKVAIAYHELAHGNDFLRNELRARVTNGQVVINGSKHVINNVERAPAIVLFARTGDAQSGRDHSVIFLEKSSITAGHMEYLARYRTMGVRGCGLGGISFVDAIVPQDCIVGGIGAGVEIAMRSFQVTRTVLPGMAIGMLDTGLRSVLDFASHRALYSGFTSEIPHVRNLLAKAFVDLLIADCLVHTVARGLHIAPTQSAAHSAAVKYLVPLMIEEGMNELSTILSARSYLRSGRYAIFGKHLRDVPVISLGHAGGIACLLNIIPQLPLLAKRAASASGPADELFDLETPLGEINFDRLSILVTGGDSVIETLSVSCREFSDYDNETKPVASLLLEFLQHASALWTESRHIPLNERGAAASLGTIGLAMRYSILLAAAGCVGTWRFHRRFGGDKFLSSTPWILAALTRLRERLGGIRRALPHELSEEVFSELLHRFNSNCCFDLHGLPVRG
jgi:alkylation response protein AidB-like acyl-CoA dehydrogenase